MEKNINEYFNKRFKELLTEEVLNIFYEEISEYEQSCLYKLPDEKIIQWNHKFWELFKLNRRYTDLESALISHEIRKEERNEANTNLIRLSDKISNCKQELEKIKNNRSQSGAASSVSPFYDLHARNGVVSIRPTLKGKVGNDTDSYDPAVGK